MVGLKAEENWLFSVLTIVSLSVGVNELTAGVNERKDVARRTSLAVRSISNSGGVY